LRDESDARKKMLHIEVKLAFVSSCAIPADELSSFFWVNKILPYSKFLIIVNLKGSSMKYSAPGFLCNPSLHG
jgi:hypothetical protein